MFCHGKEPRDSRGWEVIQWFLRVSALLLQDGAGFGQRAAGSRHQSVLSASGTSACPFLPHAEDSDHRVIPVITSYHPWVQTMILSKQKNKIVYQKAFRSCDIFLAFCFQVSCFFLCWFTENSYIQMLILLWPVCLMLWASMVVISYTPNMHVPEKITSGMSHVDTVEFILYFWHNICKRVFFFFFFFRALWYVTGSRHAKTVLR